MKIANIGCNYTHPEDFVIDRPRGSGDYLLLILKSPAFFELNGQRQNAPAHSVVIFRKGTPQHYGAANAPFINDWIHFDMEDAEAEQLEKLDIPFDTIFPIHTTATLSEIIQSLFQAHYSVTLFQSRYLELYFELLLLKLAETVHAQDEKKQSPYYDALRSLRNEIYMNPSADWHLDVICKKLNLSRSYIQHLYKHFFHCSIMSDILNSRMGNARYLLSSTNLTVNVIARACAFTSDVHFMRTFKKITGITPSQFRAHAAISPEELKKGMEHHPFQL